MRILTATEENLTGAWTPSSEEDRRAVREQLDRMLDNPLFRNSKRYPNLLRHLVEETLAGNEAELKERLLGVVVFHRSPDYDTNQDTVVRLTAAEVRKRIAQYYHQPGHSSQLQIDLVAGSYVPVFRRPAPQAQHGSAFPGESTEEAARHEEGALISDLPTAGAAWHDSSEIHQTPEAIPLSGATTPVKSQTPSHSLRALTRALLWSTAGLVLLAAVGGVLFWSNANRVAHRADRQLWAPILEEPGQVHLVAADLSATVSQTQAAETRQTGGLFDVLRMGEMVNYRDSLAQTDIVAFLARHNKSYSLQLSTQATYPELQKSASILIGGLDNVWTMRVTGPLRYHFVRYGNSFTFGIVDRQHPELGGWNEDLGQPTDRITEDYALVARIFDQTTGRPVLVVAGLGANGTAAAAQFLLDPERTAELTAHAPRDWQRLNMEAVLRTQILDNHAGPPRLVACTFW